MATIRVNVSLSSDVLSRIDSYCKDNGMPRSAFLQLSAVQYLDAVEAMPSVNKMLAAMAAVVDGTLKGEMSPDVAQNRLDSIQTTYTALTGKDIPKK